MPKESSATNAKNYITSSKSKRQNPLLLLPAHTSGPSRERCKLSCIAGASLRHAVTQDLCHRPFPGALTKCPKTILRRSELDDGIIVLGGAWFQVQGKRKYDVLVKREHTFLFSFYQMRLV